jgi:hypothetical protein
MDGFHDELLLDPIVHALVWTVAILLVRQLP